MNTVVPALVSPVLSLPLAGVVSPGQVTEENMNNTTIYTYIGQCGYIGTSLTEKWKALKCKPSANCACAEQANWWAIVVQVNLWMKAVKCKPSANCACVVPLIDGSGYCSTSNLWSPASSSRRVWHGLYTVVDSMRQSIDTLCCDLLYLQDAQSNRVNSHIGLFTCFSRRNSWTRHFYENRHFKNKASVALNPLVSLFYLFVARSGRERGNRWTEKPTLAAHGKKELS